MIRKLRIPAAVQDLNWPGLLLTRDRHWERMGQGYRSAAACAAADTRCRLLNALIESLRPYLGTNPRMIVRQALMRHNGAPISEGPVNAVGGGL